MVHSFFFFCVFSGVDCKFINAFVKYQRLCKDLAMYSNSEGELKHSPPEPQSTNGEVITPSQQNLQRRRNTTLGIITTTSTRSLLLSCSLCNFNATSQTNATDTQRLYAVLECVRVSLRHVEGIFERSNGEILHMLFAKPCVTAYIATIGSDSSLLLQFAADISNAIVNAHSDDNNFQRQQRQQRPSGFTRRRTTSLPNV